ncbi:MAG TPA: DUF882 domain-containing protein [Pseudolabrys sp.]
MPVLSARQFLMSCSAAAIIRAATRAHGAAITRTGIRISAAALLIALGSQSLQTAVANGDTRSLTFHHLHTGEDITITFKRDGRYDQSALKKLNWFMRDWRRNESVEMNPQLFDILWDAYREVGGKLPIQVICGYRSPDTNAMLRRRSSGVAQASEHTQGNAMDFFIPGVSLELLRNVGLRLQRGGVGFYPTSGSPFVHMDTGSVRHWPRLTHDQLVKIFPDGRTVHIGTDGQPLKNYALALADIERRGGHASNVSLAAAGMRGEQQVASAATNGAMDNDGRMVNRGGNFFARLFGKSSDEDEAAADTAPRGTPAADSRPAPMPATVATTRIARAQTATETTASIPLPHARPDAPQAQPAVQPTILASLPLPKPAPGRSATAANPLAQMPFRTASADPDVTAELVADQDADQGTTPLPSMLSYAAMEPADGARETPRPAAASQAAAPMGERLQQRTTYKNALPKSSPPATAAVQSPAQLSASIAARRYHEPWLRAVLIAPDVSHYLTALPVGTPDGRQLAPAMQKPNMALTATFRIDPNDGLRTDRFTGDAVVFMATTAFFGRTASLTR